MRRCWMCKRTKTRDSFSKGQNHCRPCHTIWQRNYRRTLRGFLDQKYTAMQKRVRGKDRNCLATIAGLEIMPRHEFITWALSQTTLLPMFECYKASNWQFKLCPTIDRIDPTVGYVIGNIRFLTQSENAKGSCWNRATLSKEYIAANWGLNNG